MSKRIYIAAPYTRRAELLHLSLQLPPTITITSRWLYGADAALDHHGTTKQMRTWALTDLDDIAASDALVLFTDTVSYRGGCHFEAGYAHARGKQIIVVGPLGNIFHTLPGVERFDTWGDARPWLIRWASAEQEAAA